MAFSFDNLLMLGAGGIFVGGFYYLYSHDKLNLGGDMIDDTPTDDSQDNPAYTGGFAYYMKRKLQCRDNHLTAQYLAGQGVKVASWKLFNDNKIYPAMCGGPGPYTVLVAIPLTDTQGGSILKSFGFEEYHGQPLPSNVPIPNPPNANLAVAYMGRKGPFTAYRTFNVR